MKVLHLIARFNTGGTATWISNLASSQQVNGYEVLICTGRVSKGEREDSTIRNVPSKYLKNLGREISIFADLMAFFEIRRILIEYRPDLINTHTAKAGVLGRIAALSLGSKRPYIVHTIHGHLLYGYFGRIGRMLVILFERFLANRTDMLLFAGERVLRDCLAEGIGKNCQTYVVRPGVRPPLKLTRLEARANLGLERIGSNVCVGWLARIAPIKRLDRVLGVAALLPHITFLIGGGGEDLSKYKETAPDNCFFLGWVDPSNFWNSCDIALLTSDNEALPISLIEAQLLSIPAVTTPAGSAIEVVKHNHSGLVADFSIQGLAAAIEKLVNSVSLRAKMGKNAEHDATEIFSLERQFRDHNEAYSKAMRCDER